MRCDQDQVVAVLEFESFQSLLGFLMRCDWTIPTQPYPESHVSIPAGFSDALRLDRCLHVL